jgi:peptidoglycan/LPS O-acetylase OafA/YrhL
VGAAGHVLWYVSVIAISYVLGWASYAWVEEPLMRYSRAITPGAPAAVPFETKEL